MLPLFACLNGQIGVDFGAIECVLVNGGNRCALPGGFLSQFDRLAVRCIFMVRNKGRGMAKQAGLDAAVGEYVMFCGAGDTLYSVETLRRFLDAIDGERPDMLDSRWYEERVDPAAGARSYILRDEDRIRTHGKAFRRAFLLDRNIRFSEKPRNADSHFLALASVETNVRRIDEITYLARAARKR